MFTVNDAAGVLLLPVCVVSVGVNVAVMPCGLVPTCAGVNVAEQVAALPPLGARVQVPNTSVLSVDVNPIVPCGFDCGAESVSVIVTATVLA